TIKAKQDWVITDEMKVQSYAFSRDLLHIVFDGATLEIRANGLAVSWDVLHSPSSPLVPCGHRCMLVHTEYDNRPELFDRQAVLNPIVGKRIRYAPCSTGLYLLCQEEQEIGLFSLPLVDVMGWLLHYS